MRTGLGYLRLDPASFWCLTPIEFAAACGTGPRTATLVRRGDLAALMQRYPDGDEK